MAFVSGEYEQYLARNGCNVIVMVGLKFMCGKCSAEFRLIREVTPAGDASPAFFECPECNRKVKPVPYRIDNNRSVCPESTPQAARSRPGAFKPGAYGGGWQ